MGDSLKREWADKAKAVLVGKTIASVRYLTDKETEDLMWSSASLLIVFTDGSYMFPSADDEGNDGGALFTNFGGDLDVIPVVR